jgi:hypothetical protein
MDVGLGRMAGSLGGCTIVFWWWWRPLLLEWWSIKLGSCMGRSGDPGAPWPLGDMERDPISGVGDGADAVMTGDWLNEEPDEMEAFRFRRLLPWLSW